MMAKYYKTFFFTREREREGEEELEEGILTEAEGLVPFTSLY
jgi:hypothetical protein